MVPGLHSGHISRLREPFSVRIDQIYSPGQSPRTLEVSLRGQCLTLIDQRASFIAVGHCHRILRKIDPDILRDRHRSLHIGQSADDIRIGAFPGQDIHRISPFIVRRVKSGLHILTVGGLHYILALRKRDRLVHYSVMILNCLHYHSVLVIPDYHLECRVILLRLDLRHRQV